MGTIITVAVSIYYFIISYRLQFAYFFFVFLIPFLPKYIGFGVGGEGFALSLQRILLLILFISAFVSFMQNSKYILKRISLVYQQNKILINLLLVLFVIKVVSLSLNSREFALYIMLFFDFLFSVFIFMMTILLIDSEETIHHLVKIFFYGYTIVLILVVIESILKFPLLSIFISSQIEYIRDYSESFIRGGSYRVNGSFISPIPLGEYLVIMFPIIVSYMFRSKYSLLLKIIYFLLFVYAIYSTGSRSAILMSGGIVYLYFIILLYRNSKFSRFVAHVLNLIVFVIVLYFVYNYISDLLMNFHGRFDKLGSEESASSTSRALQYVAVYNKMQEAPFFGFGRERNFVTMFNFFAIDNYYFWIILEVGIIGILAYILFLYTLVKTGLDQYKSIDKNYYLSALLIGIILNILYQILVSAPENLIYLYIFAGLICVMKVLQNNKLTKLE